MRKLLLLLVMMLPVHILAEEGKCYPPEVHISQEDLLDIELQDELNNSLYNDEEVATEPIPEQPVESVQPIEPSVPNEPVLEKPKYDDNQENSIAPWLYILLGILIAAILCVLWKCREIFYGWVRWLFSPFFPQPPCDYTNDISGLKNVLEKLAKDVEEIKKGKDKPDPVEPPKPAPPTDPVVGPAVDVPKKESVKQKKFDDGYAKNFFATHRELDVQDLVLFALYYREAIELLRNEKFVDNQGQVLQGQKITAQKIDQYVKQQFMKRSDARNILNPKLSVYNEAFIGVLYKEAVGKLRNDEFNVLGAKATADAIDEWVTTEFLRRTGTINF